MIIITVLIIPHQPLLLSRPPQAPFLTLVKAFNATADASVTAMVPSSVSEALSFSVLKCALCVVLSLLPWLLGKS
jgi:hypothetical protein